MIQDHFGKELTLEGFSTWATQERTLAHEKFSSESKILLWGEPNGEAKDHQHPSKHWPAWTCTPTSHCVCDTKLRASSSSQPLRSGLQPPRADKTFYNWPFLEAVKLGKRTPSTAMGKENTHNLFFAPWVTILYGFLAVDVTVKFSYYTLSTPRLSCLYSSRILKKMTLTHLEREHLDYKEGSAVCSQN